jgi:hypothetical protein
MDDLRGSTDSIAGPVAEGSVSTWAAPIVYEVFGSEVVVASAEYE